MPWGKSSAILNVILVLTYCCPEIKGIYVNSNISDYVSSYTCV